ncbi:MAG: GxxExxY protein [Deltaproteobacteria bacterium RBG_13_61_14]|nr:MAG: GxxExxY protein [Deltaproteobacteria bacterium RBG_13_61_14]
MVTAKEVKQRLSGPKIDIEALNDLSGKIVDAAIEVHRHLGPGLLESAYESCLARELSQRGLEIQRQVELPIHYKGEQLEVSFRIDILVQDLIIVEIKAVEQILGVHEAQVITYLKLSGCPLGLLLNFNTKLMKNGIRRFRN